MIVMDFMRLLSLGCVFGRLFSPFLMFFLLHVPIVTPTPTPMTAHSDVPALRTLYD